MTKFIRYFACLATFVILTSYAPAALEDVTHFSQALDREQPLRVFVPEPAEADERFPALYVLHGKSGNYDNWTENANAEEAAQAYRMILVFPDGGGHATYVDSPTMPEEQYETYLTRDLIEYIDGNYPTIPRREARGIMGLSLGGHGAFLMAAKHPDLYGSASSLSGIMKLTNHNTWADINERMGPWRENHDFWKENSVWEQADRFDGSEVHLMFDTGIDDRAVGAYWEGLMLHERLLDLEVPHIWRVHSGTHSWTYWTDHLPDHLNFHQAVMIDAMENQEKWFTKYFTRMTDFVRENEQATIDPPEGTTLALLGSSTFERFSQDMLPGYHLYNRGIVSDHVGIYERGLSKRLELSIFDMDPDIAVINMGVNDIGDQHRSDTGEPTEYQISREYERIYKEIKARLPETRLYITTCTPVGGRFAHLNETIVLWNRWIVSFAKANNIPLINLYPSVVADGILNEEFTNDGLHLNDDGYVLWTNLMLKAIEEPDSGYTVYELGDTEEGN